MPLKLESNCISVKNYHGRHPHRPELFASQLSPVLTTTHFVPSDWVGERMLFFLCLSMKLLASISSLLIAGNNRRREVKRKQTKTLYSGEETAVNPSTALKQTPATKLTMFQFTCKGGQRGFWTLLLIMGYVTSEEIGRDDW